MALRQFVANRECCCTGSEFVLQLISGGSLDLLLRVENVLQEEVKKQDLKGATRKVLTRKVLTSNVLTKL